MTETRKLIKVGSRKSQLAMIQTNSVVAKLKEIYPDAEFEITTMTTTGDKILDIALSKIGEKSLFTKELENGLLDRSVDFVVHSLKDLPTVLPEGLVVGAVCKRDSPYDAVVMHPDLKDKTLANLPKDSVIGTSSLRRCAQIHKKYPHLIIKDIRGNLNTRYDKLTRAQDYQAIILAEAGLDRMGWQDRMSYRLGADECLYAVAQGAMAVECRAGDQDILDFVSKLNDYTTLLQVVCERAFLMKLEGGCSVPVGVCSEVQSGKLSLNGGVFSIDGEEAVMDSLSTAVPDQDEPSAKQSPRVNGPKQFAAIVAEYFPQSALQAAKDLGTKLAERMMAAGAHEILTVAKKQTETEILQQKAEKEAKNGINTHPKAAETSSQ